MDAKEDVWYQIVFWSAREEAWRPFSGTGQEIYNNKGDAEWRYGLICEWNPHMHFGVTRVVMTPYICTMKDRKVE